jgi:hypothetical protein
MQSHFKAEWPAMSRACSEGMEGLQDARRSRRGTKGQAEWKLPALKAQVDVIFTGGDRGFRAVQEATKTIPILLSTTPGRTCDRLLGQFFLGET